MLITTAGAQLTEEDDSASLNSSDEEELTFDKADLCDQVRWPSNEYGTLPGAPWCRKRYQLSLAGLHEEMLDLYEWLRPSPLEKALRHRVFERVRGVIERVWPSAKVAVFGSLFTGLFLPTSDIDVVVEVQPLDEPPLWKTAEALKASGIAERINVLDKAFVPIVKMVDKDTKIFLDISFNTVQGVRAAKYIEQMKSRYPVLEPLVLILKQFLMQRQLNQVFTGGLSSYGLILMLISFLQLHPSHDFSHKSITDVNMGMLLLNFLQLYGQEFNYMKTALRIRGGGAYVCKEEMLTRMSRPSNSMLCIEDPLQPGNDIGRCSHNILFVRQAFEHALCTLCAVFIRPREHSPIWKSHYNGSLLAHIVIISARHIRYRNWLRGRVLSDGNVSPSFSKTSTPEGCMSVTLNTSILSQPGVLFHCNHSSLCASPHCRSTSATNPRTCSCVATVEDAKSPIHTPT
uniref:polynucleotide adenylyltransferase n=1 Tax=Parascaris univalens TaxID=6257 RepID=A0A915ACN7_PARUN